MQKEFKKIYNIAFSPTGSSLEASGHIIEPFGGEKIVIDLCEEIADEIQIEQDAICIFSAPCYGGRIPKTARERLQKIRGTRTPAVVCVTFGNRAFEDALLELSDVVSENSFEVVAGCAVVTEHNIMHIYGQGRPNDADKEQMQKFGADIIQKLKELKKDKPYIPGNHPYKEWHGVTTPIIVDENNCTNCGVCVQKCPVKAISSNGYTIDTEACISCMRCIKICPAKCRSVSEDCVNGLIAKVGRFCEERKENQFYL